MYVHAIFSLPDWSCLRVRTIYFSKFPVPLRKWNADNDIDGLSYYWEMIILSKWLTDHRVMDWSGYITHYWCLSKREKKRQGYNIWIDNSPYQTKKIWE